MGENITNNNALYIFDNETNAELGKIDNIKSIEMDSNVEEEVDLYHNIKKSIKKEHTFVVDFDNKEEILKEITSKIQGKEKYNIQLLKPVRYRKHKKKRIDKKWLKKYGYKYFIIMAKGIKIDINT